MSTVTSLAEAPTTSTSKPSTSTVTRTPTTTSITRTTAFNTFQLVTKGDKFKFHLRFVASPENLNLAAAKKEVILSDSRAFSLYKSRYLFIGFLMRTNVRGIEVRTTVPLNVDTWYRITITKTTESLCIACKVMGAPSIPIESCIDTGATMVPVGNLSYGERLLGVAKGFAQDLSLDETLIR